MTRLSDTRVTYEFSFLRNTGTCFAVMVDFNYKRQLFFTVHVHNGLVRRKVILFFITTTRCSSMQSELDPSDIRSNPVIMDFDLSKAPPARNKHRRRTLSTLLQKKRIFLSLCFDTMLYGISCVCARAAHIDLVLVPCIGTSIDLEFSFRRCLQPKTAHQNRIRILGRRPKFYKKIKKKKRSELCHQKSLSATRPLFWVG